MATIRIIPLGAAQEVTGSAFLVEMDGGPYLIDCGLFQGGEDVDARNRELSINLQDLKGIFLTHAHLDHCGRLPWLFARGYRGPIYSTTATRDLAQFILLDSAKVQMEDYLRHSRKLMRAGQEAEHPLYGESDVLFAMNLFRPEHYEQPIRLSDGGSRAIFHQSGHVLGSAFLELRSGGKTVLFSGDLGGYGRTVVPDPMDPPAADLVFCESTYGDREHRPLEQSVEELAEAVNWAYRSGGNLVIPAFALERSQDLLFYLRELRERKEVPANPVFLDSPLSINLTEVYRHHADDLDRETQALIQEGRDPFLFPGLQYSLEADQSRAINAKDHVVIIAGSGMCQGGRIQHHLKHNLWRKDSAVVFVGYQANGTLGRAIVDGAKKVHIYGESIMVQARILTINGFSAHGDREALLFWLGKTGNARLVINHGEPESSSKMVEALVQAGRRAEAAMPGVAYEV